MDQEHLQKLREGRKAKENARIQKLRELNFKKYGQHEASTSKILPAPKPETLVRNLSSNSNVKPVKNNFHINSYFKRAATVSVCNITGKSGVDSSSKRNDRDRKATLSSIPRASSSAGNKSQVKYAKPSMSRINNICNKKSSHSKPMVGHKNNVCISLGEPSNSTTIDSKKSKPRPQSSNPKESVFERLYKPKIVQKPTLDNVEKLRHDSNFMNKIITDANLITNRRKTTFDIKVPKPPVRRSISAVHLKKVNKNELGHCVHKWASIGERINKVSLIDINEDENFNEMVSAVKSEQKKVKFQTPIHNAEEMRAKLHKWLSLHGKSVDCYPHLQCFGVHDLPVFNVFDDENKENVALENDSDNESYTDLNGGESKEEALKQWREVSYISDSGDLETSRDTTLTSSISPRHDELLLGALNDLTELLRIGYNWEECARWLRAIRNRFSVAQERAEYWECRAALEETRGDIPASVQCWEHAIAKGAERSAAEANLDQLLDKFMQLKINPNSCKKKLVEPKLVDAKNVFKSTIIRFAVKEAKNQSEVPTKVTLTPVRRSWRLSCQNKHTPLKLFNTLHQAAEVGNTDFVPNRALSGTP